MILGVTLLLGGYGYSAASNGGLDVYSGGIDMHSTSISNLADPSSAQDAATRSWVNTNDDYEADTNTDASTTCTGADYLAGDGSCNADSYEADTDTSASTECAGDDFLEGSGSCIDQDTVDTNTNTQLDDELPTSDVNMDSNSLKNVGQVDLDQFGNIFWTANYQIDKYDQAGGSSDDLVLESEDGMKFILWDSSSNVDASCSLTDTEWSCTATKNWIHTVNSTHNAVYSSQESPQVRAVYESNATINDGRANVSLPSHFGKTVSDTNPMLRVQATPHSLATVAVTERDDGWLVIEASKDVKVDYRITGIREGYEDKDVVRKRSDSTQ